MKFEIDEETLKKIKEWKMTLPKPEITGSIGDRFIYKFGRTGLGDTIVVEDCLSGEEKNFTDFSNW